MYRFRIMGVLVAAFAIQGGDLTYGTPPPGVIHENLSSLLQDSPVVIVGQVADISSGRAVESREEVLLFADVHINVEIRLKGTAPDSVVIEQLQGNGRVFTPEVGSRYNKGDRYLLFLRKIDDHYIPLPQGRYVLRRGRAHADMPGPLADNLNGTAESDLIGEILGRCKSGC
jgi:hypothetical protein